MLKLLKNKLNLFFNKTCRKLKLTPNYIKIKINNKSIAAQTTKRKAQVMWLNKVIKELYTKINNITVIVYNAQLKISKYYHPIEYSEIIETVKNKVNKEMYKKRKILKKKLTNLKSKQMLTENLNNNSENNSETQQITHKFNNRVENITNIQFNNNEMTLLEKGFKYSLKPNNNIKEHNKHLLNIENAILKTNHQDQQEIRAIIISELNKKENSDQNNNNKKVHINKTDETKIISNIKNKLKINNSIITKADKGNTIVIMKADEYNSKINEYIKNNNIQKLQADPTNEYNTKIKHIINKSKNILSDKTIRYCKAIKPAPPIITGLPKIHKENTPIRPLINFTTAPTYKIAKHINKLLKEYIKVENNYSLNNNLELIDKIQSIKIPNSAKLASFDISNMYTNIPIKETIEITRKLLTKNNIKTTDINEITNLITEITKQNYFIHNDEFYIQTEGLPMGSPLSGTLAEIYLNDFENKYVINDNNIYRRNIIYWYRYVDDVILLFNGSNRQLEKLHNYINNREPSIKFTLETETDKQINFLDLSIKNNNSKHSFKIYRKPTQTDHTIHHSSHHPYQHKISAYNHMLNRLNNIPMNKEDYDEELNIIKQIADNNGFKTTLIDKINNRTKMKQHLNLMTTLTKLDNKQSEKYISVEYNQTTSNIIHKTFNRFGYMTAYKTNNKIGQKLKHSKLKPPTDTGVYKITCNDCSQFYLGQTGRSFEKRFKEHISDIQKPEPKSNFAQHIKEQKHTYTDYNSNLTILHRVKKGQTLDRLEELEIYKNKDNTNILNDKINTKTNKIYDHIIKNNNKNRRS